MTSSPFRITALALTLVAFAAPTQAQVPDTLKHTLYSISARSQGGAEQGQSVAVEGNLAVVGAPLDDTRGQDNGVVKVYDATTGELLHVFADPNPGPGSAATNQFGHSVAVFGTRVVVGVYRDNAGAPGAGSVYVYDLTSATPTVPVLTLRNPAPAATSAFGYAVAISGTRVVVGVPGIYTTDAGRAYVYDLASAAPTAPVATFNNPTPVANDQFGRSVAISGARVVVGAYQDDTGAADAGSTYVYDLSSATPTLPIATLNNPSPASGDKFGNTVGICGTRVVVGAALDDTGLY